jgi:hypothetical protein
MINSNYLVTKEMHLIGIAVACTFLDSTQLLSEHKLSTSTYSMIFSRKKLPFQSKGRSVPPF